MARDQFQTLTEPLYFTLLAQFLENDLITRVEVDKKGKYYNITDEGRDLLEEEVERLKLLIDNYENHFDK